jgi:para-nitrobenzyl esterase
MYGDQAAGILKVYYAADDSEVERVATDLASDRFIAYSTWRWSDLQAETGKDRVYRYHYERPRPGPRLAQKSPDPKGAVHSSEIEYALGSLPTNRVYDWQPEDYEVSAILQGYFANFIKKGDPNGLGLPEWPVVIPGKPAEVMHVNVHTYASQEKHRERYLFMKKLSKE